MREVRTELRCGGWIVLLREHEDPLRMGESSKQGEKRSRTQVPAWVYLHALPSHLVRTKEFENSEYLLGSHNKTVVKVDQKIFH